MVGKSGEHDRFSGLYITQLLLGVHAFLLLNNVKVCLGFYPNLIILVFKQLCSDRFFLKGNVLTKLASEQFATTMPSGATCWLAEPVTLFSCAQ